MGSESKVCPICNGTGKNSVQVDAGLGTDTCMTCAGAGRVRVSKGKGDGGESVCFVATATLGDSAHPYLAELRGYRDDVLVSTRIGRQVISLYSVIGPVLAKIIRRNSALKKLSLALIIRPVLHLARKHRKVSPG